VAGHNPTEDVQALARLYYSPNHMWLDAADDGCWHVGVDDLLARVLGAVDRVTYVTPEGLARPSAVLTVNGWDLEMVFPNPLAITGCNSHLRADPTLLTSNPYTSGWLFEGRQPGAAAGISSGLRHGTAALGWMLREMTRISEFAGGPYLADGGTPQNVMRQLERERALQLFHEFFSLARAESERR
jgi:glycine cleavage system H lipoate-binding protein